MKQTRGQSMYPRAGLVLYEVEVDAYYKDPVKVLGRLQRHGEIKEERYLWGRDHYGRPVRVKLIIIIAVPRRSVRRFKITVTQLDNALASKIKYTETPDPVTENG